MKIASLAALLLMLASPVYAQSETPPRIDGVNWRAAGGEHIRPANIDIRVPRSVGMLTLADLRAFRPGGDDVAAIYRSADRAVIATLYIYRPTAAHAGNTVLMTDAVIKQNYGAGVAPLAATIVPFAGVPHGMFRRTYDNLSSSNSVLGDLMSGPNASVLMVGQLGDWLVKLRVTGPSAQRSQVEAAADALAGAVRPDRKLAAIPLLNDTITNCPESEAEGSRRVTAIPQSDPAERIAASLFVVAGLSGLTAEQAAEARSLCIVDRTQNPGGVSIALRPSGTDRDVGMVLFGDAGNGLLVIEVEPGQPKRYVVAQLNGNATIYGPFERAPSARQLLETTAGGDPAWLGPALAAASRNAEGKVDIQLDMAED